MHRSRLLVLLALIVAIAFLSQPALAAPQYDFAILNPQMSPKESGVARNEPLAIGEMCKRFGWTYRFVDFSDINNGSVNSATYGAFVCPGGKMIRDKFITPQGNAYLRQFVNAGGGYISFCGGSFQACSRMMWDGADTLPHPTQEYRDVKSVANGLQLFRGTGWGPFGWIVHGGQQYEPEKINASATEMQAIGMPAHTRIPYAGGPVFYPADSVPGYEVWGWTQEPEGMEKQYGGGLVGQGRPSIIRFNYGRGAVVLFAHHPCMIPTGQINGVQVLPPHLVKAWEHAAEGYSADQVNAFNYNSWNILHAGMQVVLHQAPTKLVVGQQPPARVKE